MNSPARTVHTEAPAWREARPSAPLRPLRDIAAASGVTNDWWRGAAIYQVYPRSFQDSNGDGLGDLRGITLRLPYVAALGVDAIRIAPFAEDCEVDPQLGSLADFDALLAEAHHLGLKVLIDLALEPQAASGTLAFWTRRGVDGFGLDLDTGRAALHAGEGRLQMARSAALMAQDCSPRFIHGVLDAFVREAGSAWPCWALNSQDVSRVATRWRALGGRSARLAPLLLALLGSLRGAICLYQGEELGLTEAQIAPEPMQSAGGERVCPAFAGRDGCRTPMPWQVKRVHAGFSIASPWLPVPDHHRSAAVDVQLQAPRSALRRYQEFLHWRQRQPALREGSMTLLPAHDQVVAFERNAKGERVLCAFNLSADEAHVALPAGMALCKMRGHGFDGRVEAGALVLPPHEAYFGRVERRHMPLG